MMLWLIFAALTGIVIGIVIFPLLKNAAGKTLPRIDYDIVVYRDQLKEIGQEIERGLLTEDQADAARAEVHRRMLVAEDAELEILVKPARVSNRYTRLLAIIAIAVVLPVGAAVMYGILGSPHLAGKPYAWRLKNETTFVVATTAEKLAASLQNTPSAAGYKRLSEMYFGAGNYKQAAAADRRAIELGANDVATWSELGEAVVMANGGMVVPEAMIAFNKALGMDSRSERSRFYIGLAEAQINNFKQAVAIWRDLERSSDPNAPWLPMVRGHITAFAKEGGFDPASVPPSPPSVANINIAIAAMTSALHTQGNMSAPAATASNGTDQDNAIRGMVAQLAARMEKNPNDVDGWRRLAHAYNVLGEQSKARKAIDHAVHLKPNDVNVQLTLAETQRAAAAPADETPADFISTMRRVLKLDPANVQALYYVGLAEQKVGHREIARVMWNKALSAAAPDDPLATRIHNQLDVLSGKAKSK